jgi:hypothetical protein
MSAQGADTPNDLDLMNQATRNQLARVRTVLPARVLSYDRATQTVSAQVLIRSAFVDPETRLLDTYLPKPIPKVPVLWMGGANGSITFELAAGDQGLLMCAERSIDEWKQTGDVDNTARDIRRFDLSDALFLPAGKALPDALPATAVDATALVIAAALLKLGDNTAVDFVALSSLVDAELAKIKLAYDVHVHGGVTVGLGITAIPTPTIPALAPTAATKVKAK